MHYIPTCQCWSHSEGYGAQGEQTPDGLGRARAAHEVEGDGPEQGDEAAIEQSHAWGWGEVEGG